MPTPVTESSEGGQHVEWSETFHAFLFRARIYLKRFGWIIIFTVLAGGLVQVWKTRDIPPSFVSEAEMQVQMQISSGLSAGPSANDSSTINYFATQVYNLNHSRLRDTAYKNTLEQWPPPPGSPRPTVSASVEFLPSTYILRLHATGSDPDFTTHYLATLMQDYLDEKADKRQQRLKGFSITLDGMVNEYDDSIRKLYEERALFVSKNNLTDLSSAIDSADGKLRKLIERQNELESQFSRVKTAEKNPAPVLDKPPTPPTLATARTDASSPGAVATLPLANGMGIQTFVVPKPGEEIDLKDSKTYSEYIIGTNVELIDRDLASVGLLPSAPEYQLKKDDKVRMQIRVEQLTDGGLAEKHPLLVGLQNKLKSAESDLLGMRRQRVEKLEGLKASIELELAGVQEEEKQLQGKILEYRSIKNELDKIDFRIQMNRDRLSMVIANKVAIPQATNLDQEMLTISEPASPAVIVAQNPMRKIGEGAFIGFAGGLIIVFLLGALDGRVMSVEDLSQRFDEPILGVIPMQKRISGQVELLKNNDQRQQFAESCRNIRSSLLYMDRQGQRPRVIMLTSSMPSEGKSTLSANLSITLGFASSRTLLVDADMRRGQLHKRFGVKNDRGLAEHIQDGLSLDDVIQHTNSENLDFISCGKYPMQPGELLMSERFRESIQTLRARYDFVIFDSPPILLTDDAASFATRADAVVFVVRAGFTRLRQVRTSLESLNRRGVNAYGMVVNFIDHREPSYYSYRYYDYYSYRPGRTS